MPQAACAAPGRHQLPAPERGRTREHRAGQRPLRDQRDHGQAREEQDAGAGQHAPGDRIGGGQRQIVARLVHHRVVQPAAVVAGSAGQQARGRFGEPAQRPAARQLAAQDRVAVLAVGGATAALAPDQQRVPQEPGHRPEVSRRLALLLGDEEEGRAYQRPGQAAAHHPEHGPQRQVDREDIQRAAPVEHARMAAGRGRLTDLPGRELAVVHHRVGDHPHLVAGRVRPPAEVDVVAEQGQVAVEAVELVPDVAADQHACRADRQHGPAAVMLALVDLARLDPGEAPSRPVGGDARLAHHAPVRQVFQLRAEDRHRSAAAGPVEQLLEGVKGWLTVVVQQPYPLGPLNPLNLRNRAARRSRRGPAGHGVLQSAGDGCAVTRVRLHAEDRVLAEQLGQRRPAAVQAAGVYPDDALHGIRLLAHRVDESRQQPCAVVCHDHGGDDVTEVRCVL